MNDVVFENRRFYLGLLLAFILLPVIGSVVPRFMAYGPGIVALVGLALYRPVTQNWPQLPKNYMALALAVLGLGGISALWSLDSAESIERVYKLFGILLGGGTALSVFRDLPQHAVCFFSRAFPVILIIALLVNVLELWLSGQAYFLVRDIENAEPFNPSEINRNVLCAVLPLFLAFGLLFIANYEVRLRIVLKALLLGLTFAILLMTDSQSAQLALLLGTIFLLLFPYQYKWAWIALGVILQLLVLSAPWTSMYLFKYVAPFIDNLSWFQSGYAPHRMEIWDFVSRYALDSPLYGFGIEATKMVEAFDTAQKYQLGVDILHPHNFAVQLWMEFGALGALAGSAFIGFLLYQLYKLPENAQRLLLPTFIATLCVASTGYGLWQSWWIGEFTILAVFGCLTVQALRTAEER